MPTFCGASTVEREEAEQNEVLVELPVSSSFMSWSWSAAAASLLSA